jgi:predicted methyltransferase
MTVLEYDRRLVEFLAASAGELHAQCQVEAFDLMWRLPGSIRGQHDVVLCDPPYTVPGLRLFVSRAIDALRPGPGKHIYLSYPQKSPSEALAAQSWLAQRGLLVREAIRGFNRYHGASVLANQSDMIVLETTADTRPDAEADSLTDIYTYSRRTRDSRYLCKQCRTEHTVGPRHDHLTIQDLKCAGCPHCGGTRFDRITARAASREENCVSTTAT